FPGEGKVFDEIADFENGLRVSGSWRLHAFESGRAGVTCDAGTSGEFRPRLRHPAARLPSLPDRLQCRMLIALRNPERAARREAAAFRPVERIGWRAFDRGQPLVALRVAIEARRRVEQRP